ncbi:type IV conjugative transfer system protein TraL [Photobacterium makurazakiensis]|uniref:type IV conjugative transfer system protein TraL n=1 Tax=Photobacterium makurazakiensis TaxID=2910234 RepID=UPI003D137326
MESPHQFYYIPRHLNRGKTFAGLPRDEVLPALFFLIVLFAMRHEVISLIACAGWFIGLRQIKRQYGDNAIQLLLYWYGSKHIAESMFPKSPPSEKRYWIK